MCVRCYHRELLFFFRLTRRPPKATLFPYTTLFRSSSGRMRMSFFIARSSANVPPCSTRRTLADDLRSEEHTSELQSRFDLVCRLLLEKKKLNSIDSLHIVVVLLTVELPVPDTHVTL